MATSKPLVAVGLKNQELWHGQKLEDFIPKEIYEVLEQDLRLVPLSEAIGNKDILQEIVGIFTIGHKSINYDLFPKLRAVATLGVGVDGLNVGALKERGVAVINTPTTVACAAADVAVGLIIAVGRQFRACLTKVLNQALPNVFDLSTDVHLKTVGLVGFGNIGSQIAKRLKGFDVTIYYHQRNRRTDDRQFDAKYFPVLDQMLPLCDFVVICLPLTEETKHMFNKDRLLLMKTSSFLINIARGAIVDTNALVMALESGHIAGAGLDVTDPEPLPKNHPLLGMENVFLLPHICTASLETRTKMAREMADGLRTVLQGKTPPNVV